MDRDGHLVPAGKSVKPSHIHRRLSAICGKHLHTALCSAGYGASTVARKLHRWLSVSGIATRLKNGSAKPSEIPKEMAAM